MTLQCLHSWPLPLSFLYRFCRRPGSQGLCHHDPCASLSGVLGRVLLPSQTVGSVQVSLVWSVFIFCIFSPPAASCAIVSFLFLFCVLRVNVIGGETYRFDDSAFLSWVWGPCYRHLKTSRNV